MTWQLYPGGMILLEELRRRWPHIEWHVTQKRLGPRDNRTDGETDVIYSVAPVVDGKRGKTVGPELFEVRVNSNCYDQEMVDKDTADAVEQVVLTIGYDARFWRGDQSCLC